MSIAVALTGILGLTVIGMVADRARGSEGQIGNGAAVMFTAPKPTVDLNDPKVIGAGERKFAQTCAYCHGYQGTGGRGPRLKGRAGLTIGYLYNTISNGRIIGAQSMPPWKYTFSPQQIWELVAYVHSLAGKTPVSSK